KTLVGTYMDPTMGCHYDFHTLVDGQVVDADPEGFQIGVSQQAGGTGPGGNGGDGTSGSGADSGSDGAVLTGGHGAGGGGGSGGTGAPVGGGDPGSGPTGTPVAGGGTAPDGTPADAGTLERPIPNPFTSGMHMAYAVADAGEHVEISVYDLAGRRMRTLVSSFEPAGRHDVAWDGRDESGGRVRRGMYFIHIRIGAQARQVGVHVRH